MISSIVRIGRMILFDAIIPSIRVQLWSLLSLSLIALILIIWNNIDVINREAYAFASYYQNTNTWWATALTGSAASLIIGSASTVVGSALAGIIFFVPPIAHLYKYYPFSLVCEYRAPRTPEGAPGIMEEKEKIAFQQKSLPEADYDLDFVISAGKHVEDYEIQIELPDSVEQVGFQPYEENSELTNDLRIIGSSAVVGDESTINIVIEKVSTVAPGGEMMTLTDVESDRLLDHVKLMPVSREEY